MSVSDTLAVKSKLQSDSFMEHFFFQDTKSTTYFKNGLDGVSLYLPTSNMLLEKLHNTTC